MRRVLLLVAFLCLPVGCRSNESAAESRRAARSDRLVDIDVSRRTVSVHVQRPDDEDVDVHVAWP